MPLQRTWSLVSRDTHGRKRWATRPAHRNKCAANFGAHDRSVGRPPAPRSCSRHRGCRPSVALTILNIFRMCYMEVARDEKLPLVPSADTVALSPISCKPRLYIPTNSAPKLLANVLLVEAAVATLKVQCSAPTRLLHRPVAIRQCRIFHDVHSLVCFGCTLQL